MQSTTTTTAFLNQLRHLGVELKANGDRLRCSAPPGVLTAELQAKLTERKAELLAWLRNGGGSVSRAAVPPLRRVSRDQQLPLSFAQQRFWFLNQLEPDNPYYNIPEAVRLKDKVIVPALEQTLGEIVRRPIAVS